MKASFEYVAPRKVEEIPLEKESFLSYRKHETSLPEEWGAQHRDGSLMDSLRFNSSVEFRPCATAQMMRWETLKAKGTFEPRFGHVAVRLAVKGTTGAVLVWGGADRERCHMKGTVQAFWEEKGEWKIHPVKGVAPVGRTGHTATLDASGNRLIIIGGVSPFGERLHSVDVLTGVYDMQNLYWNCPHKAQWRLNSPYTHPVQESYKRDDWCGCHPSVFKRSKDGVKDREYFSDHWKPYVFTHESQKFLARSHHTCVMRGGRFYVFGGAVKDGIYSDELWCLDPNAFGGVSRDAIDVEYVKDAKDRHHRYSIELTGKVVAFTWTLIPTEGQCPSPRAGHAAAMLPDGLHMLVLGGVNVEGSEVFTLDLQSFTWTRISVIGLPSISYATLTPVGNTGRFIIFGGFTLDGKSVNNIYILDSKSWSVSEVNVQGDIPKGRGLHTASFANDRIIVSSGFSGAQVVEDMYVLRNPFDSSGFMSSLGADLLKCFDKEEDSDVSFNVQGKQIFCHKIVLASRSQRMRSRFAEQGDTSSVIEISDARFTYPVFRVMLQYLYSDSVFLTHENAKQLLDLATEYGLDQLAAIASSCFMHVQVPPSRLTSDIGWALCSPLMSDMMVNVEGEDIPAHRIILKSRSSYFKAMLDSGFREGKEGRVTLQDCDRQTVDNVMRYIYTDTFDSSAQNAFDLFCNASLFAVESLQERCEQHLLDYLDEGNVVTLLEAGDRYSSSLLRDQCLIFLNSHYDSLMEQGAFDEASDFAIDLIRSHRAKLGLYVGNLGKPRGEIHDNMYYDIERVTCSKCKQVFVYRRDEWDKSVPTPIEQLNGLCKKGQIIYKDKLDIQNQLGHQVSVTLNDKEYFPKRRGYGSKQDARQNAALMAFHAIQCGVTLPKNL